MKNLSWTMILLGLVVLLIGCGAPGAPSQQAALSPPATAAATAAALVPTIVPSPTAQEPAPSSTPLPTAQEPAPSSTPLPTAQEPVPSSTPLPTVVVPTTDAPTPTPPAPGPTATTNVALTVQDVQRITPAEAKALLDGGEAILYDVRSAAEYNAGHAAGALSFPDSEVDARFGELPAGLSLVFY